jgi:hypothetical protein
MTMWCVVTIPGMFTGVTLLLAKTISENPYLAMLLLGICSTETRIPYLITKILYLKVRVRYNPKPSQVGLYNNLLCWNQTVSFKVWLDHVLDKKPIRFINLKINLDNLKISNQNQTLQIVWLLPNQFWRRRKPIS